MFRLYIKIMLLILMLICSCIDIEAQDKVWTFEDCIDYALEQNIDIKQANLKIEQDKVNQYQLKSSRLPSINASVSQSVGWEKVYNTSNSEYGAFTNSNATSYNISSDLLLFNGFKIKTQIQQSNIDIESKQYYSARIKESVEISILNAYLNILYAQEAVNNAQSQVETTQEQLTLYEEKLALGMISNSDFLQFKSELASENLTLAKSKSTLTIAKVDLMQLIELPVTDSFIIVMPDIEKDMNIEATFSANTIYELALQNKPQIKEAELNVKRVMFEEKISKAELLPSLTLNADIGTGWTGNGSDYNYAMQLGNKLSPYLRIGLSIPIYQKNQVSSNIKTARISVNSAKLEEIETKNTLRKEIEQAVADYTTAKIDYRAGIEQHDAIKASYQVASEKFELGIINAIELKVVKNELIVSERNLLQTKYNLLFSRKIIDFYTGNPIRLSE